MAASKTATGAAEEAATTTKTTPAKATAAKTTAASKAATATKSTTASKTARAKTAKGGAKSKARADDEDGEDEDLDPAELEAEAAADDTTDASDEAAADGDVPSLERVEYEYLQRVLADCSGNVSEAARRLRMHRRSLQRKIGRSPPRR